MRIHKNRLDPRPLRCGRCASILPEEIQTFCQSCGAPFSRIPPTSSYITLTEHRVRREDRLNRLRLAGLLLFSLVALTLFTTLTARVLQTFETTKLEANRAIEFYTMDFPEFPSLSKLEKREAIVQSVQAFEDHFGIPLNEYSVRENEVPEILNHFFLESQIDPQLKQQLFDVNFWQREIFPLATKSWDINLSAPLIVFVTNLPLKITKKITEKNELEVRHIGDSQLVSGLGHPALVVASSFRILNPEAKQFSDSLDIKTSKDRSRYMAEYVIAHELGHALLGIPDFVEEKVRTPASFQTPPCLMHTDIGGGRQSWEKLRNRPLGSPSNCTEYKGYTEAHQLRAQAIFSVKIGRPQESLKLYEQAVETLHNTEAPKWISEAWEKEQRRVEKSF